MFNYRLYALIIIFVMSGCAKRIDAIVVNKKGTIRGSSGTIPKSIFKDTTSTLLFKDYKGTAINVTYLGCGGFNIEKDGHTVLIDPFYSNPQFFKTIPGLSYVTKMRSKTDIIDHYYGKVFDRVSQNIACILVSHSHHDHLMDVPYVYHKFCKGSNTRIYGSKSTKKLLKYQKGIPCDQVIVVDDHSFNCNNIKTEHHSFFEADSTIRITSIFTNHAPHVKLGFLSIKAFKGESIYRKKYTEPTGKTKAHWWNEGQTLAFVIDYLDAKQNVKFRIFVQSSASDGRNGWMSEAFKKERPVDLAVLGIASFKNVDAYPEALIAHLAPKKMIICHWEDFFRRYDKKKKLVRGTNIKKGINRVDKVFPWTFNGKDQIAFPHPGTLIQLKGY